MIVTSVAAVDLVAMVDSGLFDAVWYAQRYPDVVDAGCDPWEHFVTQGWREGRSPGPAFDLEWYRCRYAEELEADSNPLVFFLQEGWRRGHWPSASFDPEQYLSVHPEAQGLDVPTVLHALASGADYD